MDVYSLDPEFLHQYTCNIQVYVNAFVYVCTYTHTQPYTFQLVLFLLHPLPSLLLSLDCRLAGSDAVPVLHCLGTSCLEGKMRVFLYYKY